MADEPSIESVGPSAPDTPNSVRVDPQSPVEAVSTHGDSADAVNDAAKDTEKQHGAAAATSSRRVVAIVVDGFNFACGTSSLSSELTHLELEVRLSLATRFACDVSQVVVPAAGRAFLHPDPTDALGKNIITESEHTKASIYLHQVKQLGWRVVASGFKRDGRRWVASSEDIAFADECAKFAATDAFDPVGASSSRFSATDIVLVTADRDHLTTLNSKVGNPTHLRWCCAVRAPACNFSVALERWGQQTERLISFTPSPAVQQKQDLPAVGKRSRAVATSGAAMPAASGPEPVPERVVGTISVAATGSAVPARGFDVQGRKLQGSDAPTKTVATALPGPPPAQRGGPQAAQAASSERVTGKISFYDDSKFGFVKPDSGSPSEAFFPPQSVNVRLRTKYLQKKIELKGLRVTFVLKPDPKAADKMIAFDIHEAEPNANKAVELPAGRETGVIVTYDDSNFGFIKPDKGGADRLFLPGQLDQSVRQRHKSWMFNLKGKRVSFVLDDKPKGNVPYEKLKAVKVCLLEEVTATPTTRRTGRVAKAEPSFGFIRPDDGNPDLFFVPEGLNEALRQQFVQGRVSLMGKAVTFAVEPDAARKRDVAVDVHLADPTTASAQGPTKVDMSERLVGTIVKYDDSRYGFLKPDEGGRDRFFAPIALQPEFRARFQRGEVKLVGMRVSYILAPDGKGVDKARDLVPLAATEDAPAQATSSPTAVGAAPKEAAVTAVATAPTDIPQPPLPGPPIAPSRPQREPQVMDVPDADWVEDTKPMQQHRSEGASGPAAVAVPPANEEASHEEGVSDAVPPTAEVSVPSWVAQRVPVRANKQAPQWLNEWVSSVGDDGPPGSS